MEKGGKYQHCDVNMIQMTQKNKIDVVSGIRNEKCNRNPNSITKLNCNPHIN